MTETVAVFMLSVLAGIVANYIYDFLCKIFKVLWIQKLDNLSQEEISNL